MNNKLPSFLQPFLASYNLSKLKPAIDKPLIVTSILNKGDGRAIQWLGKNYSLEEIKESIRKPARGFWYKWALEYWQKIFQISLPKNIFNQAIIKF